MNTASAGLISLLLAVLALPLNARAANAYPGIDPNDAILKTISDMEGRLVNRGYDLHSAFTEDIPYGSRCCVPATNSGKTMCVALIAEVLIRTINGLANGVETRAFEALPISHWTGSKRLQIRPHLFQYKEVHSKGPGDALTRFGIGETVDFEGMKAGDLLAFSRFNGSGHAVVFLGFVGANNARLQSYSANAIGFEYFSAQKTTKGIGKRFAYFGSVRNTRCPSFAPLGSDCGVIKEKFSNAGRLWPVEKWRVKDALVELKRSFKEDLMKSGAATSDTIERELESDLPHSYSVDFSE